MTPTERKIEDRIARANASLLRELDRITFWQLVAYVVLLALACCVLTACGSDYASPFDAPDKSTEPVTCAASAACG